jgi:hypothetical protein
VKLLGVNKNGWHAVVPVGLGPHAPPWQLCPQAPQLMGSEARLTQAPLHKVRPVPHGTQLPVPEQSVPAAVHVLPPQQG